MLLRSLSRALFGAGLAACAVAAAPRAAAAQAMLPFGTWQRFEWFDGVGSIDGDGFRFTSAVETRLRVTDAFFGGDAFTILLNGIPLFQTPSVALDGGGAARDTGDAAWADPTLSHAEYTLAPGEWVIQLAVREDAGYGAGEGFLRVDELPPVSTVPEPAPVALAGAGLAALALVARRRGRA